MTHLSDKELFRSPTRLYSQDGAVAGELFSDSQVGSGVDGSISDLEWSNDGSAHGDLLAVASPDDLIRIYTSDAVPLASLRGHTGIIQAVSWHPQGERLASADDKAITYVWNLPKRLP